MACTRPRISQMAHFPTSSVTVASSASAATSSSPAAVFTGLPTSAPMLTAEYLLSGEFPHDMISTMAAILTDLCETNDTRDCPVISKFHAASKPTITIKEYLMRVRQYAECSDACFILALIYVDRIQAHPDFIVNSLNIHRLLITSVMLAAKFFDDHYFNNSFYARIGGVSKEEMNQLELEFLFMTSFSLSVSTEEYQQYDFELRAQHAATLNISLPSRPCSSASLGDCAMDSRMADLAQQDQVAATVAGFNANFPGVTSPVSMDADSDGSFSDASSYSSHTSFHPSCASFPAQLAWPAGSTTSDVCSFTAPDCNSSNASDKYLPVESAAGTFPSAAEWETMRRFLVQSQVAANNAVGLDSSAPNSAGAVHQPVNPFAYFGASFPPFSANLMQAHQFQPQPQQTPQQHQHAMAMQQHHLSQQQTLRTPQPHNHMFGHMASAPNYSPVHPAYPSMAGATADLSAMSPADYSRFGGVPANLASLKMGALNQALYQLFAPNIS